MKWTTFLPAAIVCTLGLHVLTPEAIMAADKADAIALPEGKTFEDIRLQPPKDLNGYFPFEVPESKEAWAKRAEELRRRILVSNGLWPMPPKTPLNAVIHGKVERDGFTVEKVYFEAVPGFYVTGMLFRPVGKQGPFPGVLCPHGHGGRLQDDGIDAVRKKIVKGEERFEASGRMPKLALCAQLARMGCVSFMYDMIGYADSNQLSRELGHGFRKQRPEMEGPVEWGLYSAQAEMRVQSIMGLHTWTSIRALDFLESLPDVDAKRLGVTGGSGGGTQTILLGAIDSRPVVAFPQGMVSTAMQGGCPCENTSLLRIGTGNVELAALFAPRPQAMTTANDWTKDMMTHGYPELKKLYKMLGKEKDVDCRDMPQFPHNYNYVTRAMMYSWFNKHLKLGLQEPVIEEDWEPLGDFPGKDNNNAPPAYSVWNDEHPAPKEKGDSFERKLVKQLTEQSDEQIQAAWPTNAASVKPYQELVGKAVETILGRTLEDVGPIERTKVKKTDCKDYLLFADLITISKHKEQLPVISLFPVGKEWNGRVVIWFTGSGKAGLFSEDGTPIPAVQKLLKNGDAVVSADLFAQGEFLSDKLPGDKNRTVKNPREFAGYTYTYNDTLFVQRVHDVLSVIKWVKKDDHNAKKIELVGTDGAGPIVAAAGAVSGDVVQGVAVEINDFRFTNITNYLDPNFIPGIVKYGDVPALLALNAPKRLLVIGDEASKAVVTQKAYAATSGKIDWKPKSEQANDEIGTWLTK